MCGELIKALKFSGLDNTVVAVDDFFINMESRLRERNLRAGLQFATPLVDDHDDFDAAFIPHLTNQQELPQVIVFDTFTCNRDRSPDNLLLAFEDPERKSRACKFFLIDHTEAFGANWNERSVKALESNDGIWMDCVNFDHVPPQMDSFEPSLVSLEALTPELIESIVHTVPSDWRFPLGDAVALTEFLVNRRTMVRSIIERSLKPEGD